MPKKKSTHIHSNRSSRRLSVRGVLRKTPDLAKIAGTLEALALALAQAEKDAEAAREQERSDER